MKGKLFKFNEVSLKFEQIETGFTDDRIVMIVLKLILILAVLCFFVETLHEKNVRIAEYKTYQKLSDSTIVFMNKEVMMSEDISTHIIKDFGIDTTKKQQYFQVKFCRNCNKRYN
jgi:hypothetical protein